MFENFLAMRLRSQTPNGALHGTRSVCDLFWWRLHHEPAIFEISFFGRGVTLITPAGLHPDSVMFEAVILMAYGGGGFAPPEPLPEHYPGPRPFGVSDP